ncbi:MAG: hypothetical protein A2W91_16040 [Bacteroidetes bacterium GWF2_38_335]|nr:MAG: hypothetical protein A2W91_16040 [Bacteroidetes bacterium GWF2_38_335]OFY81200.1 MAG: hypothetical protein A2281_07015 [Bacteroidetes bacterium RIFOXYA12_FULL_38_20]HBS85316.1 hypothetical protein [Bacteroidales bacterium]
MFKNIHIPLKLKLFLPVAFIIIAVVALATIFYISSSIKTINRQIENSLLLQVNTVAKMFERERDLKLENVKQDMEVAFALFSKHKYAFSAEKFEMTITNQETKQKISCAIPDFYLDNRRLLDNDDLVDSLQQLLSGTVTIFQKIDSGFVRISTNVLNIDSSRAIGTFIPNNSPVAKTILQKKDYYGRAFVVNDWYITAYKPFYLDGEIAGMLYVGDREKNLDELRKILHDMKIGESGYTYVFEKDGNVLIHPKLEGQNWKDSAVFKEIISNKDGIIHYEFYGEEKTAAIAYFPDFEIYIAAAVVTENETRGFIKRNIIKSGLIALGAMILLIGFLWYLTADRLYRYLRQAEISNKRLSNTREALRQSEDRFQKLFDSTGDDIFVTDTQERIIEVNQSACINLGYERNELLQRKMIDIKTSKFAPLVHHNRKKIYELGKYTFESEHVTKDGKVIPVEITSRVVDYKNEKLILSISRNIGERKEIEREILSAVIRAEERERERFARDMHDGIGPLLSTVKLYVSELKTENMEQDERNELVKTSNEILDEAIISTRNISNNLMPRVIHQYGLVKALEAFCEKVSKKSSIKIDLDASDLPERMDQNLELIFFRITSELINNTLKHAKAQNISIIFRKADNKMFLRFTDDGVGFDVEQIMHSDKAGMGLKNIISRVKSIDGIYNFESGKGNGFKIEIEITL